MWLCVFLLFESVRYVYYLYLGSVVAGTVLTISGEGFDFDTPVNNVVTIGGTPCVVTGFTGQDLLCNVGAGHAGTHDVIMHVMGYGLAAYSSTILQFTYAFNVSGIEPVTGGLGGMIQNNQFVYVHF